MTKTVQLTTTGKDSKNPHISGPIELRLVFVMPRKKKMAKLEFWKTTYPDLDKMIRAVGDSLTKAFVYEDDARICVIHAMKRYASELEVPGVHAMIRPITVTEAHEVFAFQYQDKDMK